MNESLVIIGGGDHVRPAVHEIEVVEVLDETTNVRGEIVTNTDFEDIDVAAHEFWEMAMVDVKIVIPFPNAPAGGSGVVEIPETVGNGRSIRGGGDEEAGLISGGRQAWRAKSNPRRRAGNWEMIWTHVLRCRMILAETLIHLPSLGRNDITGLRAGVQKGRIVSNPISEHLRFGTRRILVPDNRMPVLLINRGGAEEKIGTTDKRGEVNGVCPILFGTLFEGVTDLNRILPLRFFHNGRMICGMAMPRGEPITDEQLTGWKHFRRFLPLLDRLHGAATARDRPSINNFSHALLNRSSPSWAFSCNRSTMTNVWTICRAS
ncbi:MAG: hypothetical protein WC058_03240 [Phycisphaeraceae bacterium]